MTHLDKVNGSTSPANSILVFGLSDEGKPQAGLFSVSQATLAKKAAKQLGLTALPVSSADLATIKAKIPAGRLYANRRSFVPAARRDVHEKLLEFARASGSQSRGGKPHFQSSVNQAGELAPRRLPILANLTTELQL